MQAPPTDEPERWVGVNRLTLMQLPEHRGFTLVTARLDDGTPRYRFIAVEGDLMTGIVIRREAYFSRERMDEERRWFESMALAAKTYTGLGRVYTGPSIPVKECWELRDILALGRSLYGDGWSSSVSAPRDDLLAENPGDTDDPRYLWRRFEHAGARCMWGIYLLGNRVTTRSAPIGESEAQVGRFPRTSRADAISLYERLVRGKIDQGYVEVASPYTAATPVPGWPSPKAHEEEESLGIHLHR